VVNVHPAIVLVKSELTITVGKKLINDSSVTGNLLQFE
jgi:hypothetical protein